MVNKKIKAKISPMKAIGKNKSAMYVKTVYQ